MGGIACVPWMPGTWASCRAGTLKGWPAGTGPGARPPGPPLAVRPAPHPPLAPPAAAAGTAAAKSEIYMRIWESTYTYRQGREKTHPNHRLTFLVFLYFRVYCKYILTLEIVDFVYFSIMSTGFLSVRLPEIVLIFHKF